MALSDVFAAFATTLQGAAGATVSLGRAGSVGGDVTAWKGQSIYEATDRNGVAYTVRAADWMIKVADYVFDGVAAEPKRGDTITHGSTVYKVVTQGEREFEFADSERTWFRIHTVEK